MEEIEYRKAKGINYSALARFNESQDHALLPFKHKSYFEIGKMFETLLQDACTGSTMFEEKYFVCDVSGKMPDNLIELIDLNSNLEDEIVYNKDGVTRSKTHKTKHAYIDECIKNPGMYPVSNSINDMLCKLVENMLKMEILGSTGFEILSQCKWQVPVFWEKDGIYKKALYDTVLNLPAETYLFDIKTAANQLQFNQMAQKKYWIQRDHYTEGAEAEWGNVKCFTFLNAYKELPFLCEPVDINGDRSFEYGELCRNFVNWLKDGRPEKGYLPERKVYLYSK